MSDPQAFGSGRHFAAWLVLTPKENSSGGRRRPGRISRQGDEGLRRLVVLGATAVIRFAKPGRAGPWLLDLLARRPRKVTAVALANKMARILWAMLVSGELYRRPQPASTAHPRSNLALASRAARRRSVESLQTGGRPQMGRISPLPSTKVMRCRRCVLQARSRVRPGSCNRPPWPQLRRVPGVRAAASANMAVIGFCGGSHCPAGHDYALRRNGAITTVDDFRDLLPKINALALPPRRTAACFCEIASSRSLSSGGAKRRPVDSSQ